MPWIDPAKRRAKCRAYHQRKREAENARSRAYHAEHREAVLARKRVRETAVTKKARDLGVSESYLLTAKAAQGGICALCHKRKAAVIDHCHRTLQFRGWLCRSCNAALGVLGDTPEALYFAYRYVGAKGWDENAA